MVSIRFPMDSAGLEPKPRQGDLLSVRPGARCQPAREALAFPDYKHVVPEMVGVYMSALWVHKVFIFYSDKSW